MSTDLIDRMHPMTSRMVDENSEIRNIMDPITGNLRNTNSDHSAIHAGEGNCLHLYLATLAAEGVQRWRIKGPTAKFAHIKGIQISAQGAPLVARLIKDMTITNTGTIVENCIANLNDNIDLEAETKVYDSGVTYTGGTVWCSTVIQGSSTNQAISSGSFIQNDNLEYVTKDGDTDYVLEIENLDGSDEANFINVNMFFYEETRGLISNGY